MTEDQLSRLFQRGVQFNANELQAGKGSGLGLYIAKGICERHGGSLVPASEGLGKGTTFTLTIPLHHIPDAALPKLCRRMSCSRSKAQPERQNSTPRSTSFSPGKDDQLKILVVDDSGLNRKLLVRLVWHCFAPSKILHAYNRPPTAFQARLLTKCGHNCDEAEDGQQAVNRVKESITNNCPYQVILSKLIRWRNCHISRTN